jgi:LmbE family N-acetylglucosaminyl deacetylase
MPWVYLSPHFDDVALSCGGLVWEQVQAGEPVSIWTICAGEPPVGGLSPFAQQLHARWGVGMNAPAQRKTEDMRSCHILGAEYQHFPISDCIYRRAPQSGEFMYASEDELNGPMHPGDTALIQDLYRKLQNHLPPNATLVCPVGLGNHVDHQLTRLAAEAMDDKVTYYADFPYALSHEDQLSRLTASGWSYQTHTISDTGLQAWQGSIAAHASQISTFWANTAEMEQVIKEYWLESGGVRLWVRPIR